MENTAFVGTEVKYLVKIESCGFDQATDDFDIILKRGTVTRTFHKADLVEETTASGKNYYLCFDTTDFGPGNITCIVKAYVPDNDFQDGIRTEIDKFPLLTDIAL